MRKYKILVVDDYPEHIEIITTFLLKDNKDYQILAAPNGKVACKIAFKELPDLIIMDWDMPVMNGMEATENLKANEKTKNIPIIIVSGYHNGSGAIEEALRKGAIDFVHKPIERLELVARVHSMIRCIDSYNELIKQKEINFKQEIRYKTEELSMHALYIAKFNEFQFYTIKELKKIFELSNSKSKKLLYDLIEVINKQIKENVWEKLEKDFINVFSDFYINLGFRFPSLTINERKLCLLLRMNLSSKEIANITFQEINSVNIARYRLRQKLNLNKEENLVSFLLSLG